MGKYVSKPRLIGKLTLGTLGKAGTIYFTTKDLIGDFQGKRYFSAGVDATSALVGVYTGAQIMAGAGIGVSVAIDYISNLTKETYYRRK